MSATSLAKGMVLAVWGLFGVGILSADENRSPRNESAPQKEMAAVKTSPQCDYQIATWLAIESELYSEISESAGKRATQQAVRQFAQNADKSHRELVAKLHDPLEKMAQSKFDVSKVLKEITQRWEDTYGSNRRVLGFRGGGTTPAGEQSGPTAEAEKKAEGRLADVRKKIAQQRETMNKALATMREARGQGQDREAQKKEDNAAARSDLKKLREARVALRDLRRERDQAFRDLLAARGQTVGKSVSERVPQLLRTISDAVQKSGGSAQGLLFSDIHRQVAKRTAEAIKHELEQVSGENFDRAYLACEVFGQLRMIQALEVAKEHASQDLRPILESSITTAQDQLRQARELLQHVSGIKG
jgi:hypothetical protein